MKREGIAEFVKEPLTHLNVREGGRVPTCVHLPRKSGIRHATFRGTCGIVKAAIGRKSTEVGFV